MVYAEGLIKVQTSSVHWVYFKLSLLLRNWNLSLWPQITDASFVRLGHLQAKSDLPGTLTLS